METDAMADMDNEQVFDLLFDQAADLLSSDSDDFDIDEYAPEITLFAAYFAAHDSDHFIEVVDGDAEVDEAMIREILGQLELDATDENVKAAVENVKGLAEGVADFAFDGDHDDGDD